MHRCRPARLCPECEAWIVLEQANVRGDAHRTVYRCPTDAAPLAEVVMRADGSDYTGYAELMLRRDGRWREWPA